MLDAQPYLGYFHARKEDVRPGSALEKNPPFATLDLVIRLDYDLEVAARELLEGAIAHVLRYGKVGKQSKARLRAALKAVEVSDGHASS